MAVAIGLADTGRYGKRSLHWPPGAPVAFAAAAKLSGRRRARPGPGHPGGLLGPVAGRHGLIPLVFALALAAAGETRDRRPRGEHSGAATTAPLAAAPRRAIVAGLVAAAVVATYPPLIEATGDLLSEPLGALWLTAALLALARRRFALAGLLLAAAVLTRANLLVLIPVVAVMLGRRGGWFAVAALVPVGRGRSISARR